MKFTIYSANWCTYCKAAKQLLSTRGFNYEEINIEEIGMSREQLFEITGGMSVPQIMINKKSIGGFEDLFELSQSRKLTELVNQ